MRENFEEDRTKFLVDGEGRDLNGRISRGEWDKKI